jgi:hypothetical protein
MSEPTPGTAVRFHKGTTSPFGVGWPLILAGLYLGIGIWLGTVAELGATTPASATVLTVLATLTAGAGAIALLRTPTAAPTRPFIALASAVASLLALTPVAGPTTPDLPLPLFLLLAPWRYALAPLVVHFALAIGWPHRKRYWSGLVIGWYMLHVALFVAAVGGFLAGEAPLLTMVDTVVRAQVLDSIAALTAILALGLSLASPARRGAQRRATYWAFAAMLFGFVPRAVSALLPAMSVPIDGTMTGAQLSLALIAFLGLAAILALPLVNPINRDIQAYHLNQRLLDEAELPEALRAMAAVLRSTFEADGVSIRLTTPRVHVTEGETRTDTTDAIAPEVETIDDQRTLVAPIGRASDPLGEVRLFAQHAGAFSAREREWLAAFLIPVGAALRARRREQLLKDRTGTLARDVLDAAAELRQAVLRLPEDPRDDGLAVPPPVDASEVLGQLKDGLDGVSRKSDDLEAAAGDARTRIRDASDEVAQALDALRAFTADLLRLSTWNDAITSSNQSVSGVAFRTNLLANNASLEATRAGSAGKTFGVLAEEIRRLADATASSSSAIEDATRSLTEELASRVAALEAVQTSLVSAIRESETGEDAARQVADTASVVLSHARSLKPAVEEAYAVARRRSARDDKLTSTTERLLAEREAMAHALSEHRTAVDRVREVLERLGRPGSGRR